MIYGIRRIGSHINIFKKATGTINPFRLPTLSTRIGEMSWVITIEILGIADNKPICVAEASILKAYGVI
jgi:hypothetical protein